MGRGRGRGRGRAVSRNVSTPNAHQRSLVSIYTSHSHVGMYSIRSWQLYIH